MKSKEVLITGGAGFIGSNIALNLVEKGYSVTVLDSLSPQIHGKDPESSSLYRSVKDKVNFILGDVRDRSIWKKIIPNVEIIIHLAAETGTGQSMYEIEKYIDVNINGTALMLDVLTNCKHSVEKVIIASSRAIYGEGKYKCAEHGIVFPEKRKESDMLRKDFYVKCPYCDTNVQLVATDEESKIHPTSIYGITKQTQEQMVMLSCKSIGLPCVAFRYQNVYGPGQSLKNPYTGILSIFSTILRNNNLVNIFEDGKESRDFIYIDDVVRATILGVEKVEANFNVYNVGTGVPVEVLNIANFLKEEYESSGEIKITGAFRVGDIRHNFADISKIQNDLEFNPIFDFKKGVSIFADWVKTQPVENNIFSKSIDEMREKGLYK